MSVRRVRRGVYQVRWREAGRGSPAHSVMVYGTTDGEARRKADTIDAEIRNRKAAGERVISIAPDRPEPLTLAEFLPVWHDAHGRDLARSTQESYAMIWDRWIGPRLGGRLLQDITPAEVARFRREIERKGAGSPTVLRALAVLGSVLTEAVRPDRDESDSGGESPAAASSSCGSPADTGAGGDHPLWPGIRHRSGTRDAAGLRRAAPAGGAGGGVERHHGR